MRFNGDAYLKLYPRKAKQNAIDTEYDRAIEIEPKNDKVVEVETEEVKAETETETPGEK